MRDYFTAPSPLEGKPKPIVFVFDYDGTLAPIVDVPSRARMRPSTRALLIELSKLAPCCAISGRARADVLDRLEGVPMSIVVGNHGMEWGNARDQNLDRARALVTAWVSRLLSRVEELPGAEIENKGLSLSIHYRRTKDPVAAARIVRAWVTSLEGPEGASNLIDGKAVLNVLPPGAMDKGGAVMAIASDLGARTACFVGDDVTDEHGFAIRRRKLPFEYVTVKVGESKNSEAEWLIRDQNAIDALIRNWIGAFLARS